jgi:hypothetical protein
MQHRFNDGNVTGGFKEKREQYTDLRTTSNNFRYVVDQIGRSMGVNVIIRV